MIFGTLIKVISGFYLGCVGTVTGVYLHTYQIDLVCKDQAGIVHKNKGYLDDTDIKKIGVEEFRKY